VRALGFVVILVSTAAPAAAQSINVNFGPPGTTPSASYAAAGGAGTWNTVTGISGMTFHLVATDGSPSDITVSQSPTTTLLAVTDPSVSGDDAKLLNNGLVTSSAETCLAFSGFAPGRYEVLVYAWLPDQPAVKSRTRQDEAPSTIDVGGAWTGTHVEGVSYARYVVDVGADGALPAHSGLVPGAPAAALNGVQIRLLPTGGTDGPPDAGVGGGGETGDAGSDGGGGSHGGGCSAAGGVGPGALLALALVRRRRSSRADPARR
jgi:hypothetical protein